MYRSNGTTSSTEAASLGINRGGGVPSASVMAEAKAGNPRQKSREEWRHSFFSSVIFCKENKMQVVVGGGTEKNQM